MGSTLKVTAKGQVTLKREVLDHLGVGPGDKITIDFLPSGRAEVRAAKPAGSLEGFAGLLASPETEPLSLDAINRLIADGWAGTR